MSSSDTESSNKDGKTSNPKNFKVKNMRDIKLLNTESLFEYIDVLHKLIKKQETKLKKYKNKLSKRDKETYMLQSCQKHANIATDIRTELNAEHMKSPPTDKKKSNDIQTDDCITAQDAFSFVDEMRKAAEQAQNVSNFIYEPTSGLYYDQKSGYYYNAEYGLYYDGNTGCYYKYNKKKNCYEFHSQVQVQATYSSKKEDDELDEVVFDEFGVVTDLEKVRKLREEEQQLKQKKERRFNKKSSKKMCLSKERKDKKFSHKKRKSSEKYLKSIRSDTPSEEDAKEEYEDFEDGELTTSSSSTDSDSKSDYEDEKRKVLTLKSSGRFQDIAKKYPPSLRIVVQETNLNNLKVGSLSLITYKGGSLGREGSHEVIIPDCNVSKFHLKFSYDTKQSIYKCVDLGSRNGTILNGTRMSASKAESSLYDLVHGSIIQIAQTKLLCHVHEGNSTCGLCEPGLLIESQQREVSYGFALSHKEQLKKIQRKYGLENEKFVDKNQNSGNIGITVGGGCISKSNKNTYQDRAAARRLKVGSSIDKEKTQTASVDTAISSDNKGFKMLSKLGWNKGETLGKTKESGGLLEPINVESNAGHKGLGCEDPTAGLIPTSSDKKKIDLMKKTKERYQAANIFENTYESN